MSLRSFVLALCLLPCIGLSACASETPAEHAADLYAAQEMAAAPVNGNLPDYSLPPAQLTQAQHLASLRLRLYFGGEAWTILQLILLLALGVIAWMRDTALRITRNRWLQAYIFLLLFLVARALLNLPLNLYGHHLGLNYGLSIQSWPSWFADLGKGLVLEWLVGGLLLLLLFALIHNAPRRWWLVFWIATVPIVLAGLYLSPILIDPLFDHFEPLAQHHPDLVAQLEHMGVPANRQFLMKASAKVTTPNAYVTGLANSKRIVVWDTSLTPGQSPSPEVLWMVGHECGHYVLHHVLKGTLLTLAGLLPLLYLCYRFLTWAIRRFGARWRIASPSDWGALAIILLAASILNAITEPISNTISRQIEHHADIYGEEAIHGLVPDPQLAVKNACDSDGLRALEDPNPSPWVEFWTYNHPSTGRRAAFGNAYNPWAPGMEPRYFKK
jgi:Zn-dependent protease with chaperone function